MKNYIYILVCLFIYFSCKSQEKAIEYENENLIIFKDFDPTIKVIDNNMSVHLLTYKNLIFVKDRIYSDIPRPMKLSFVKDKDTMNIVLNYGNWSNIYVKNFKFKNGNYQIVTNINSKSKKYKLTKKEIPKQKIISKNEFMGKDNDRKDVELKDMFFYEVDLSDTINTKITEIKTSANNQSFVGSERPTMKLLLNGSFGSFFNTMGLS